jgi:hypothetical protein
VRAQLLAQRCLAPGTAIRRCAGVGWLMLEPGSGVAALQDHLLRPVTSVDVPPGAGPVFACGGAGVVVVASRAGLVVQDHDARMRWHDATAAAGCHIDAAGRLWVFRPESGLLVIHDLATGRVTDVVGRLGEVGPDGGAIFVPGPDGELGVVCGGPGDGMYSAWAALDPSGPSLHLAGEMELVAVSSDALRQVQWRNYRLEVLDRRCGAVSAECDVGGGSFASVVEGGESVAMLDDALLLAAGYRWGHADEVADEHVVLSAVTLRRLAIVDYGFATGAVTLAGSSGDGTWLTMSEDGLAMLWNVGPPLAPLLGQLTLPW